MKMKQKLLTLGVTVALSGLAGTSVYAAAAQGTATALVVEPLAIVQRIEMDFGTVAGGTAAGTVTLDTAGGRTFGGDAAIFASGAGTAGVFDITGNEGFVYTITGLTGTSLTASATLENLAGDQMLVSDFQVLTDGDTIITAPESISIGATLNLLADQPGGTYTTATSGLPYTVTINYN